MLVEVLCSIVLDDKTSMKTKRKKKIINRGVIESS